MDLPGRSKHLRKLEAIDDREQAQLRKGGEISDSEMDSGSEDDTTKHINRMAEEIEETLQQKKEYAMQIDKKEAKKVRKSKALVEMQRQKKQDLEDDEALENNDLMVKPDAKLESESENDDDLDEERMLQETMREQISLKRQKKEEDNEAEEKKLFLNPLLAFKEAEKKKKTGDDSESEEWSDDDKYDPKVTKEEKRAIRSKERQLLGKKRKAGIQGDIDEVKDFFANDGIEEVPATDMEKKKKAKAEGSDSEDLPSGYSSMDSDEIAETRALAKKMLRKKFRETTISASYNRYAFDDEEKHLPSWFVEDEAKNSMPNYNLTKEEVDEEKRALLEWNARPSKKVTEAKGRKKMRLVKALTKIKSKAQVIANSDITEGSKMRQIKKMYNKEKAKHKEEKTYVVNRSFNSSQGKKTARGVKMVDAKMKKDGRNAKLKSKKKGGRGGQGKGRKGKGQQKK